MIPMTSTVGILEWVPNTVPLKSIIATEMLNDPEFVKSNKSAKRDNSIELMQINASIKREQWIGNKSPVFTNYHSKVKNLKNEDVLGIYDSINQLLPTDFLRRKLISLSANAEGFFTLRSEFAKTLASSSIFGYILGIGDRHLDNLLLDTTTGAIVQIGTLLLIVQFVL